MRRTRYIGHSMSYALDGAALFEQMSVFLSLCLSWILPSKTHASVRSYLTFQKSNVVKHRVWAPIPSKTFSKLVVICVLVEHTS